MESRDLIKKLEKWLSEPENTKAKLAAFLGYESTTTISQWIVKRHIPLRQQRQVELFISGGQNG